MESDVPQRSSKFILASSSSNRLVLSSASASLVFDVVVVVVVVASVAGTLLPPGRFQRGRLALSGVVSGNDTDAGDTNAFAACRGLVRDGLVGVATVGHLDTFLLLLPPLPSPFDDGERVGASCLDTLNDCK